MLDLDHLAKIKKTHAAYGAARRELIKLAGDALNASKRAIFAVHRDDMDEADRLLAEAEAGFAKVRALVGKNDGLDDEGSYRAALEEFVEASMYRDFVRSGKVGRVMGEHIDYEIYLGGLADLTGELQRRQVRVATDGKRDEVKALKEAIEEVVAQLLDMDLGGYLRTKFDQAKNNLRRAEDVLYEMTMRRS